MKRIFLTLFILIFTSGVAMAGPFDLVAKRGSKGEQVSSLQMMLLELGHYKGSIDGVFGQGTEDAVKLFQNKVGVPEDGVVTKHLHKHIQRQAKKVTGKKPATFARKLTMEATAYTTQDPGCGLYTARGNRLRKGLVAVDPRVIPLGTRLYIPGYGYAVADDTGGAIKGHKIDLAYESRSEALQFGRRMIEVYILE